MNDSYCLQASRSQWRDVVACIDARRSHIIERHGHQFTGTVESDHDPCGIWRCQECLAARLTAVADFLSARVTESECIDMSSLSQSATALVFTSLHRAAVLDIQHSDDHRRWLLWRDFHTQRGQWGHPPVAASDWFAPRDRARAIAATTHPSANSDDPPERPSPTEPGQLITAEGAC
ncbi:hypothetical protein [Haloglycomyces albus]|uniref:hypothetical protein n=1 Tax=Haloglycomyces albus TaxID=526067 RepID=UPI00046C917B|nr:hypothetical protein [Haloglycomyces albus]